MHWFSRWELTAYHPADRVYSYDSGRICPDLVKCKSKSGQSPIRALLQFVDKRSTCRRHFPGAEEVSSHWSGRAKEFRRQRVFLTAQRLVCICLSTLPGGGCGRARTFSRNNSTKTEVRRSTATGQAVEQAEGVCPTIIAPVSQGLKSLGENSGSARFCSARLLSGHPSYRHDPQCPLERRALQNCASFKFSPRL